MLLALIVLFLVSIRASSREDATRLLLFCRSASRFNPRVLAGGRDRLDESGNQSGKRFNPRVLAGGRDKSPSITTPVPPVSIRASSREDATIFRIITIYLNSFNPRVLAGGRDNGVAIKSNPFYSFNPRVLAGGRDLILQTHTLY